MEEIRFNVTPAPHLHHRVTVSWLMYRVVIALLPSVIASVYFFGWRSLLVISVCMGSSIIGEHLFLRIRKRESLLKDGSALVTGLLLALTLPPGIPLFTASIGSLVAIIVGKQIFGGLGHNIFNPALVGRAFLMASFPALMTRWVSPVDGRTAATTAATPLAMALPKFGTHQMVPHAKLFWGQVGGCLGETSALAILMGGIFLLLLKVIDWRIPLAYTGTAFILFGVLYLMNPQINPDPLWHLMSGGLLFGAFFMATDLVTTPITRAGRWCFGLGCGIFLFVIRTWGGLPEGVMYSILLMNAFTPLINRWTKPRTFGK